MMLGISAIFLFLLGAAGLAFHSTLPATGHIRPGFFVFYTNLSNLLLAVYQLALGVSSFFPGSGVFRLLSAPGVALSMTLCIFVTHLIYQWVLVPSATKSGKSLSDIGLSSFGNLCVHYIVPWLTVVQWLLWQDKSGLAVRHALYWLALPLAYFAFGMARGATGKPIGHTKHCYPYPFMDPQVMGKRFWPVVLLLVIAFSDWAACSWAWADCCEMKKERRSGRNVSLFCVAGRLNSRSCGPHTASAGGRRHSSPDPRRTGLRFCRGCSPDSSGRRYGV